MATLPPIIALSLVSATGYVVIVVRGDIVRAGNFFQAM
jgi:hypothetical protein